MVAADLNATYVDSGSLYRGLTWACLDAGLVVWDEDSVMGVLDARAALFFVEDGAVRYTLGGEDPRAFLRSAAVVERVSLVAAMPGVRQWVVRQLRDMLRFGNLVMEGRDIGSVVFPQAAHKFYLDANPEIRAERRRLELAASGVALAPSALEDVSKSLARRDAMDRSRASDPLRPAEDAVILDTSASSLDEVVCAILQHVRAAGRCA